MIDRLNELYIQKQRTIPNPNLIGAEETSRKLVKAIRKADGFLCVVGLSGLGKTALVQKTIHQARLGQIFQDLIWLEHQDQVQVTQLPDLCETPTLVVIDKVEAKSAATLVAQLEATVGLSKVILICRQRVPSLQNFVIPELSQEDAIALLAQRLQLYNFVFTLAKDRPTLERIYDQVGGHPLAIQTIVKHNYMFPLEHVLRDWARNASFAKILYQRVYGTLSNTLSDDAKNLLVAFAFGGPAVSMAYLQDVTEIHDLDRFTTAIQELIDLCLVQHSGPAKRRIYHAHRLTLTYIRASWNTP